ncbi:MAG: pitrilysin family protein [Eubacteriales bacterium]
MNVTRTELLPNIYLRTVETTKFKSAYLSISLKTPLAEETATANALIAAVLRRGTKNYPDMESLAGALDDLYGGSVEPAIRKRGETQAVTLFASFLDDAYTLDKKPILESAVALMGEVFLHPVTENGVFVSEYVTSEKTNLLQRIRSVVNNKGQYAKSQLIKHMCKDEAFGVEGFGSEEYIPDITPESLWERYQTLLKTSEIEIYHCGSASHDRVKVAVEQLLTLLPPRGEVLDCPCDIRITVPETPNFHAQSMDVTQGKLELGFRTSGISVWEEGCYALVLANAIFGGTSMSKLFMNVREKLSLCYYAGSNYDRLKGILTVSSGIEFDKFEEAKSEILAQLKNMQEGKITTEELEGTRNIWLDAIRTIADEQDALEGYWFSQSLIGEEESIQEAIEKAKAVTMEQVVEVSKQIKLDTIYFLKGLEE